MKSFWAESGIYIVSLMNNKYYIGQSKNIGNRLLTHLTYPKGNMRRNKYRKIHNIHVMNKSTKKEREEKEEEE